MNEIPFQLTGRQALRVTAEFLGLVVVVSAGMAAAKHLLPQLGVNLVLDDLWDLVLG